MRSDPDAVAEAVRRYALRYRQPRVNPARVVIDEHRVRDHERILKLCREAEFSDPELSADQFFFLLEGAKSCVMCIGLKRVGEHLTKLVDTLVRSRGADTSAAKSAPRKLPTRSR